MGDNQGLTDDELAAIIATFPVEEQEEIRAAEESFRAMVDRVTGRGPGLSYAEIRAIYHEPEE